MTPIFDKDGNLVAWMAEGNEDIFDLELEWAGVIIEENLFRIRDLAWVGPVKGGNFYDQEGKPFAWTVKPIEMMLKPLRPLQPLRPLRPTPLKPLTPLTPLKPFTPAEPMGGWSETAFAKEFAAAE